MLNRCIWVTVWSSPCDRCRTSGLGGSLGCGAGVALLGVLHGVSVPKNDFCSAPAMGRSARRKAVERINVSSWIDKR
jgi:hypothetical protein